MDSGLQYSVWTDGKVNHMSYWSKWIPLPNAPAYSHFGLVPWLRIGVSNLSLLSSYYVSLHSSMLPTRIFLAFYNAIWLLWLVYPYDSLTFRSKVQVFHLILIEYSLLRSKAILWSLLALLQIFRSHLCWHLASWSESGPASRILVSVSFHFCHKSYGLYDHWLYISSKR